jgi:hypothetical protein
MRAAQPSALVYACGVPSQAREESDVFEMWFEIDGRRVRPDQIGNELEAAVLRMIADQVRDQVGGVRCRVHQEYARITGTGTSPERLQFTVEGCCDELVAQVEAAFVSGARR